MFQPSSNWIREKVWHDAIYFVKLTEHVVRELSLDITSSFLLKNSKKFTWEKSFCSSIVFSFLRINSSIHFSRSQLKSFIHTSRLSLNFLLNINEVPWARMTRIIFSKLQLVKKLGKPSPWVSSPFSLSITPLNFPIR